MAERNFKVSVILGAVDNASAELQKFEKKVKDNSQSIAMAGKIMTGFGVALTGIGAYAVAQAGKFEQLEAGFTTLMGSTDAAREHLKQLTDFAAKTPFQLDELASASQLMQNFGIDAQNIMPNLKMIGDVAGANSDRFQSLSLAFSQVQASGRLMGQDLLQLINAGFNPLQVISEKTGKSMLELKKEMEKGAISADMVSEAFKTATSEGGRFYNNMQTQSTTLFGLFSTLKDNIGMTANTIGQQLLPMLKSFTDFAIRATGAIREFSDEHPTLMKNIIAVAGALGVFAVAAGPLLLVLPTLATSINTLVIPAVRSLYVVVAAHPFVAVTAAVSALTLGLMALVDAQIENGNAAVNSGKTHKDVIKMHEERIKALEYERATIQQNADLKMISEQKAFDQIAKLTEERARLIKAIEFEEKKASAEILAVKQTETAGKIVEEENYYRMAVESSSRRKQTENVIENEMKENRRNVLQEKITDHQAYVDWISEIDRINAENEVARYEATVGAHKAALDKMVANIQTMTNAGGQLLNNLMTYSSTLITNDLNKNLTAEKSKYDEKKKWIEANITDAEKRKTALEELDRNYAQSQESIRMDAERKQREEKQKMKPYLIAEAIANTAVGATKAFAQGGMFGFVTAALVLAAGMAQVATIQAQQFAQGGFVGGSSYSGDKVPARLNSGEVVLNASQQRNFMAMANGGVSGGGITIQISGNTFNGTGGVEELADIVGEEIMRRVRNERNI